MEQVAPGKVAARVAALERAHGVEIVTASIAKADVYPELLQEIENFFDVYKTLEPDKYSETRGFEGRDAAWEEIRACQARYPG